MHNWSEFAPKLHQLAKFDIELTKKTALFAKVKVIISIFKIMSMNIRFHLCVMSAIHLPKLIHYNCI